MKPWLVLLFAACTSGPNPHERVECVGYTVNGAPATSQIYCEAPCGMAESGSYPDGTGPQCTATNQTAPDHTAVCQTTIDWMGIRGCCQERGYGSGYGAYFYVCQ
jgi:hypothetical protein